MASAKVYAASYHMKGFEPKQLTAMQEHHKRTKGDLEHCDPARYDSNEIIHGNRDTWAEEFIAEVEAYKEMNMRNEVAALRARGRHKEADRRHIKGGVDPWKASGTHGPVRSVVLTADSQFFAAKGFDGFEGANFRDPKIVRRFRDMAIEFLDEHIPRENCLYMSYELDEKTPHLHAYYRAWRVKDTKTKGRQRTLQPTDMIHFRNAEKAQDQVGEWFSDIGLVRGKKTAQARREARAKGEVPPEKAERLEPWQWRLQKRLELVDCEKKSIVAAGVEEQKRRQAIAEREAATAERKALSRSVIAEDKRRADAERDHIQRMRKADADRTARIKKEDKERAEKAAKLDAREKDITRKAGLLNQALATFWPLLDKVKAFARKIGMKDSILDQSEIDAVKRVKDIVGNISGKRR